jgi:hypothetical protein
MVHVDKGVPYTPVARQMAASYRVEISLIVKITVTRSAG